MEDLLKADLQAAATANPVLSDIAFDSLLREFQSLNETKKPSAPAAAPVASPEMPPRREPDFSALLAACVRAREELTKESARAVAQSRAALTSALYSVLGVEIGLRKLHPDGLLLAVAGGQQVALPLADVDTVLVHDDPRAAVVPLHDLRAWLVDERHTEGEPGCVIVLRLRAGTVGLRVDQALATLAAPVRPPGILFQGSKGLRGVMQGGQGEIVPVPDVSHLLDSISPDRQKGSSR